MNSNTLLHLLLCFTLVTLFFGCKENPTGDLPAPFENFAPEVEAYVVDDEVVIKSDGMPNHGSPYFETSDSRYEDYSGSNPDFMLNPNRITEQNLTFRIPLNPTEATTHEATPMGAIGVAVNGVVIYNQYAAGFSPLENEINTFDQYNAHPQNTGQYHYHIEPLYLTETLGTNALIGWLLDGFPVYGPQEGGATITNADLDEYHGHFGVTPEYPEGIYHYHITEEDPYINGDGFYGTAGTMSN